MYTPRLHVWKSEDTNRMVFFTIVKIVIIRVSSVNIGRILYFAISRLGKYYYFNYGIRLEHYMECRSVFFLQSVSTLFQDSSIDIGLLRTFHSVSTSYFSFVFFRNFKALKLFHVLRIWKVTILMVNTSSLLWMNSLTRHPFHWDRSSYHPKTPRWNLLPAAASPEVPNKLKNKHFMFLTPIPLNNQLLLYSVTMIIIIMVLLN